MVAQQLTATVATFETSPEKILEFQGLRKRLFINELGWKLDSTGNREADEFDTNDAVYCLLYCDYQLIGGFRALRTDRPYLAQRVFPQLATHRAYPIDSNVWEISRFGIIAGARTRSIGRTLYSIMFRFALRRQTRALVAITDLTYERFLGSIGIKSIRYGPPQIVGESSKGNPIEAVAGEIPMSHQADNRYLSLLKLANDVEINDEALVLGRTAVSA